MKKSERLKPRIKIKFKYFILAHILTLFFVLASFSFAADNSFDFNAENGHEEPFSKLVEFLNGKKNELEKIIVKGSDFPKAEKPKSQNSKPELNNNYVKRYLETISAEFLPNLSAGPAVSYLMSAVSESVKEIVVDKPKQYFEKVFCAAKDFVFPGACKDGVNQDYVDAITQENNNKEESNALKKQYDDAIVSANELSQKFSLLQNEMEKIKAGGVIVRQPVIEQRTVEKTVERIISGLSRGDLDSGLSTLKTELDNLNTNLTNQINNLSSNTSRQTSAAFQAISLTNKIDSLTNTTITTPTISNPTVTGTLTNQTLSNSGNAAISGSLNVSGLATFANSTTTNATIADNFWSNGSTYLGDADADTLTVRAGVWSLTSTATSTVAMTNGLNFDSNTFVIDPNSNRVGIGTSTPRYTLDIDGNIRATGLVISNGQTIGGDFSITGNATLGDATTTDVTYFNSRIADFLIPTADNLLDLGDSANWLRWRTGYFGTSVGIGGTATSTGSQLIASGSYLIDSNNTLSINTTNNKAVSFGTGNVVLPYGSSTALTVSNGAWFTGGNVGIGTTSPYAKLSVVGETVSTYFTATSTTATSTFPYLSVTTNSNLGTVVGGTWQGTAIGSTYGGTGINSSALTGIAQIVSGTWSASSTLSTAFGGTGWQNIQANSILLGNGSGRIATTTAGTDGYVLALSAGVPTWLATSTLSTITGTLAVAKGGTGQTSFGQGWLNSDGATMSASTSPTVNYITATSTTATSTFAGGMSVAGSGGLTVLQNGNVGIGTTSPAQLLSVAGHCVTGDTRLRRRRKKKNGEGYEYDEVAIKDIQPGDEIASLNEETGEIVWSKVNALMDMGVKEIYKLRTADGRQIRTTSTHPYLVKDIGSRSPKHTSPVSGAGWLDVNSIKKDDWIAAPKPRAGVFIDNANIFYAQKRSGWKVDFLKFKNLLAKDFDIKVFNYYAATPDNQDTSFRATDKFLKKISQFAALKIKPLKYIEIARGKYEKKGDMDVDLSLDVRDAMDDLDVIIVASGDSDFVSLRDRVLKRAGKKFIFAGFKHNTAWEIKGGKYLEFEKIRGSVELGVENKTTPELAPGRTLLSSLYSANTFMSSLNGDKSDMVWVRVESLEKTGAEQVYDIEVEGTHNFIGNDIVAHNTYLTGGLGTGVAETTNGNITGTGRLSIASTAATSTFSTGGLAVGTSQFVVQQNSGNVGIGTTSPGAKLDVQNPTDAASNLVAIFRSGDRAVPAANDLGYFSFYNDDSTGTQTEFSRFRWKATDVTSASKDSQLEFAVMGANTLRDVMYLGTDDNFGALAIGAQPIFAQSTLFDDDHFGHTALQLTGGDSGPPIAILNAFSVTTNRAADLDFTWSRGSAYNGVTVVQNGDRLGRINWIAADGVDLDNAGATIQAVVDGVPGANDTPGRLEFLTTPDGARAPTVKMVIKETGNVGIGTTSPAQLFSVAGHCVTGDTRLHRRRKKKNGEGYDYDEVEIKDIQPGEEIASLDEETGEIVWSKVNALMDMGVKEIYKLTTASGKTIRTTAEHPYMVKKKETPRERAIALIDYANIKAWIKGKNLSVDLKVLYSALKDAGVSNVRFYYGTDAKNDKIGSFFSKLSSFGYSVITKPVQYFKIALLELLNQQANKRWLEMMDAPLKTNLLDEAVSLDERGIEFFVPKANFDVEISVDILKETESANTFILFSGDGDFAYLLKALKKLGKRTVVVSGRKSLSGSLMKEAGKFVTLERLGEKIPNLFIEKQNPPQGRVLKKCTSNIAGLLGLSSGSVDNCATSQNGLWKKVVYLKKGMEIAVSDNGKDKAGWDKIDKIEILPAEQVYDIEVEGTHNFIGNDIVAHNTYLTGGLGTGVAETTNGNITGTGRLSIASTAATSTFSTGGLAVGTSQFVVQQNSGNVGIGTTSPYAKLSVVGETVSSYFTATSTTATSTFPYLSVTTNSNLGTVVGGTWQGTAVGSIYGGTGINSSALTGIAQIVSGTWSASSTLSTAFGGTGWQNIQANSILLGNGAGRLATTSAGTDGYVLGLSAGIPTWIATSTLSTITGTLAVAKGGTGATTLTGLLQGNGTSAITGVAGTAGQFPYYNGTDTLLATSSLFLATSGNVGIGTAAPGSPLHVVNSILGGGNSGILLEHNNADLAGLQIKMYKNSTSPASGDIIGYLTYTGKNSAAVNKDYGTIRVVSDDVTSGSEDSSFRFDNFIAGVETVDVMVIKAGNLGIGTTAPGAKLHSLANTEQLRLGYDASNYWSGTVGSTGGLTLAGTGTGGALTLTPTAGQNLNVNLSTTGDLAVNTNQLYVDTSSGNVGIGTTSPVFLLDILSGTGNSGANTDNSSQLSITGANKTLTGGGATVFINSNSAQAADTGGSIALTGRNTDSSTNSVIWATIKGAKKNATSVNNDGYLAMAVQEHSAGGLVERMRINSDGNVGIGTTSPWRKLSVTGTVGFDGLTGATGAGSLCLDANKQVVYNSATDACLSSTRATKNSIANLSLDGLSVLNQLQPSSFIYNQGDGRTRYGFIAEDTALVDDRLATHNEKGEITGIDDRAILSVAVKAIKEMNIKISDLQASAAASGGTGSDGLFSWILNKFNGFGITFEYNAIKVKNVEAEKVAANDFEMKDKGTGEIYCVNILNGEWNKVKGVCGAPPPASSSSSSSSSSEASSSSSSFSSSVGESSLPAGETGSSSVASSTSDVIPAASSSAGEAGSSSVSSEASSSSSSVAN